MPRQSKSKRRASALVIALLVIMILSVVTLAFFRSVSLERMSSRSYADKFQSELLATTATDVASGRILSAIVDRPASATYFASAVDGRDARHLYLSRYRKDGNLLVTDRVPLFSTANTNFALSTNAPQPPIRTGSDVVMDADPRGGILIRVLNSAEDLYANLNATNSAYPRGVVGLTNAAGPLLLAGNWIYQTNSQRRVIGRYAFWVDDETSKIDLSTAGLVARGDGTNLAEISLRAFSSLGLSSNQVRNLANYSSAVMAGKTPVLTRYALGAGEGVADGELWDRVRPFLTKYSRHDLRSPDGYLALDPNQIVTATADPTKIAEEVQSIVRAITNSLPGYGERYFQTRGPATAPILSPPQASDPVEASPQTYLRKIAANIRDYIDADANATVIRADGSAYVGTAPDFIPYDARIGDIPVIGKERGPYLNEYGLAVRVIAPSPEPSDLASATLTVRFGHYVELFNPGPEEIRYADLGENPRVIIANRTPWKNDGSAAVFRPADVRLDLPVNFVVPACGYAVLATDAPPWSASQPDYLGSGGNRYVLSRGSGPGSWSPLGTEGQNAPAASPCEDYQIDAAGLPPDRYDLKLNGVSGDNTYAGCRERLLFVNDGGIIDYALRTYTVGDIYLGKAERNPVILSTFVADGETDAGNTNPDGSPAGPRFWRGDPRANGEISELGPGVSSVWKNGGSPAYGNATNALQATLGSENFGWADSTAVADSWRNGWAEFSTVGNGYLANTAMTSVGELGFIYDPARYNISGFRSYGRTLRVGQPDAPEYNRESNSTASATMNWIGGLGTNSPASAVYLRNAFQLASIFRVDSAGQGKLNPNGLLRSDSRVTFDALFDGYQFATNGFQTSGYLSGRSFNSKAVYSAFLGELTGGRPFVGIGDVSRLDVFATSDLDESVATGVAMSDPRVSDGDREEVFRRTAGLLSTQSLSYSVYVIGQSGRFVNGKFRVSSTSSRVTVLQYVPQYPAANGPVRPTSWKTLRPWQLDLN
jgi:hypothetical protein